MRGIWWRHKSDEDSSTTASPIDLNRNASLMTISHLHHCFKYASLMKICPMSSRLGRHTTDLLFLWKVPAILRGSRNRILTLVQKKNVWFRCTFFCYFLSYFWCFGINIGCAINKPYRSLMISARPSPLRSWVHIWHLFVQIDLVYPPPHTVWLCNK